LPRNFKYGIIFDRIDSLKPCGIILGDEEPKQNRLAKTLKVSKKAKIPRNT
jgi:putative permease